MGDFKSEVMRGTTSERSEQLRKKEDKMSYSAPAFKRIHVAFTIVLAVLIGAPLFAEAQVARVEIRPFQSTTLTDQEFLVGQKEGKPVVIAGELRIPKPGTDRLPAIILLHGSSGLAGFVDDWAHWFNEKGIATFAIDSFSARGIVSTNEDQSQLGRLAMIIDAYRGLSLLSHHPRIDPKRIVLMGFSRGGKATLYSSMTRFQKMHGPADASFAAYVAFYPDCRTTYHEDEEVSNNPIRIFHGGADNYSPVETCQTYVERLRKAGKDVELTVYPGAQHVFDGRAFKKPLTMPKAQTTRKCRLEEAANGIIINSKTRQPFTYSDPCVEYGPSFLYDEHAHEQVQKALADFMNSLTK